MTPERWHTIRRIFDQAVELPPAERAPFIEKACRGDAELRKEIESLIASHEEAPSFIEPPARAETTVALEPAAEALAGTRIGNYEILRQLGRGGMGTVYLATRADEQFRKRVAIKLVRGGADNQSIIRRFRSERQILAALDHPNIARLLDGGATEDGYPYVVMEYIEGQPIKEYCDSHRLNTFERLKLFQQVCSAVQYAHQNLIVHRDVKPANILVTAAGTPKLLDFGIAKLLLPGARAEETTEPAARVMTPEYASPEQVRGEAITTASDIYSLGVVLYELLTGHRPYRTHSRSPLEIIQAVCEQEPEKPSTAIQRVETAPGADSSAPITISPDSVSRARDSEPNKLRRQLQGDLDNIVLKAMRKEPRRRYASVEQFSEDLQSYIEGRPVIARKDTFPYRTGKFIRRHKAGVAAAVLIVLTVAGGIIGISWQGLIARQQRARAVRRFNDVRKLANSFMFEFHDAVQNLPGATPARELVVKRALEYLDGLTREAGDDLALQRELATAYEKVGDVQGDPYSASLGDTASSLASHRKALAIRETLAAATPANLELQRELASSYLKIGDLLWLGADWNAALDVYQKARHINEALVGTDTSNNQLRYDLSLNLIAVGDTLIEMGDLAGALSSQRKALAIREELAARSPEAKMRIGAAVSHIKVADVLTRTGHMDECLNEYNQGVAVFEALLAADPKNPQLRRYLMNGNQRLGEALLKIGEIDEALIPAGRNLEIAESLAAVDPTDAVARRNLLGSTTSLASALAKKRDYRRSLALYRKAQEIALALSGADPANAQARRDLMVCYDETANVLVESNSLGEAEQHYRKALAIAEELAAASPSSPQARSDLADLCAEIARLDLKKGHIDKCLPLNSRALALRERLVDEAPTNADYRYSLSTTCLDLGRCHSRLASVAGDKARGHWAYARSYCQRSLDILIKMRDEGSLLKNNYGRIDEVTKEITQCEAALAKMKPAK